MLLSDHYIPCHLAVLVQTCRANVHVSPAPPGQQRIIEVTLLGTGADRLVRTPAVQGIEVI